MCHSTIDVYQSKRKIINFAKYLVMVENKVERKFVADNVFGICSTFITQRCIFLFTYFY
ncbi:MAG: hypothetical protein ACFWUE_03115 [Xylanivirga thermophila]|jgi:hypothetical protein